MDRIEEGSVKGSAQPNMSKPLSAAPGGVFSPDAAAPPNMSMPLSAAPPNLQALRPENYMRDRTRALRIPSVRSTAVNLRTSYTRVTP